MCIVEMGWVGCRWRGVMEMGMRWDMGGGEVWG